jgi:hypothetical protein
MCFSIFPECKQKTTTVISEGLITLPDLRDQIPVCETSNHVLNVCIYSTIN